MVPPEPCHLVLFVDNKLDSSSLTELRAMLEKDSIDSKVTAMKWLINLMLQGDPCASMLMPVIRFVLPQKHKGLKKLALAYLEHCEKRGVDGKLKQEMILVCNALRNDLQHPNEFLRAATLRFVTKIDEAELLEPLVPSVQACLSHRHASVRRSAFGALAHIHAHFEHLLPDGPDIIVQALRNETDPAARRDGILALSSASIAHAAKMFLHLAQRIPDYDPAVQTAFLHVVRKTSASDAAVRKCAVSLLNVLMQSQSAMVRLEAATLLIRLSDDSNTAVSVVNVLVQLLSSESDTNTKIVLLEKIEAVIQRHPVQPDQLAADILRAVANSDSKIQEKSIGLALKAANQRNIDEVVGVLHRELTRHSPDEDSNGELRHFLVRGLIQCLDMKPSLVSSEIDLLVRYLGDKTIPAAMECVIFIKKIAGSDSRWVPQLVQHIFTELSRVNSVKICRHLLWLLGTFQMDLQLLDSAILRLLSMIKHLDGMKPMAADAEESSESSHVRVLADGTYASESPLQPSKKATSVGSFIGYLCEGRFFVAVVHVTTLLKMLARVQDKKSQNELKAKTMMAISNLIRFGLSDKTANKIDGDSLQFLVTAIRILDQPSAELEKGLLQTSAASLVESESRQAAARASPDNNIDSQIDFDINADGDTDLDFEADYERAIKADEDRVRSSSSALNTVQLTGLSDVIYAEAYPSQNQYDISCEILVVNQTNETMRNLTFDLFVLGGVKLLIKPLSFNLAPGSFEVTKATFKVTTPGDGAVHGIINYEGKSANETYSVFINPFKLDISDFLGTTAATEAAFRSKWTTLEWENKININLQGMSIEHYLEKLKKKLNLSVVSQHPVNDTDTSDFIIANLIATCSGGINVLCNICLQRNKANSFEGHGRIRSQSKGIVYAVGEELLLVMP